VGDLDRGGDLDIVSGKYYYLNPNWQPVSFRDLEGFGKDYLQDNGDHLLGVDQDGWLDIVSGQFTKPEVLCFRNSGEWSAMKTKPWIRQTLVDTKSNKKNEIPFFHDMDRDGDLDYIANSWVSGEPMKVFLHSQEEPSSLIKSHTISSRGNGHGQGFGDINGDGLEDMYINMVGTRGRRAIHLHSHGSRGKTLRYRSRVAPFSSSTSMKTVGRI